MKLFYQLHLEKSSYIKKRYMAQGACVILPLVKGNNNIVLLSDWIRPWL